MVYLSEQELEQLSIDELNKILSILINSEKYEGAGVIKKIVDKRINDLGLNDDDNSNDDIEYE